MKRPTVFFLFASVLLTSCGSFVPIQTLDKTGIEVVMNASKLKVLNLDQSKGMKTVGEAVGYSCMNKTTEPQATQVGATDQVKIAAIQMGATAITNLVCSEGGLSLIRNCWQSWECKATALQ